MAPAALEKFSRETEANDVADFPSGLEEGVQTFGIGMTYDGVSLLQCPLCASGAALCNHFDIFACHKII